MFYPKFRTFKGKTPFELERKSHRCQPDFSRVFPVFKKFSHKPNQILVETKVDYFFGQLEEL